MSQYRLLLNNKIYTLIEIYNDYVILQRDLNESETKTYWTIDNFNKWFSVVETNIPNEEILAENFIEDQTRYPGW